jgi:hypothetical protein
MNRLFFISLLILINQFATAQTPSFFLVKLAIEEKSLLNQPQNDNSKELLFKKLTNICNKADGIIIDEFSDYYLVSDIYATHSQTSNAGFLPVGTYKMNLKLKLIYKTGGKTFKEFNFPKEYAVNTEAEAANLLINDFSLSDPDLNDFFSEGNKNMKKFYSDNCNLVVENAKKYKNIGEPEKALAICLSVPSDQPCFNSLSVLVKQMYTSLSYKSDYGIFLKAQDFVSKGDYGNAFEALNGISVYSQFYSKSQLLSKQINDFIFNQKQLQKKRELADSEQRLKETEIALQQKRNELQESINYANIEIANQKNESDRSIALSEIQNKKEMKVLDLQSKERTELMKTAGNLLGAYISRPQAPKNTNFYIIK